MLFKSLRILRVLCASVVNVRHFMFKIEQTLILAILRFVFEKNRVIMDSLPQPKILFRALRATI